MYLHGDTALRCLHNSVAGRCRCLPPVHRAQASHGLLPSSSPQLPTGHGWKRAQLGGTQARAVPAHGSHPPCNSRLPGEDARSAEEPQREDPGGGVLSHENRVAVHLTDSLLCGGPAGVQGLLPQVLQTMWPQHFPTPTSARKACRKRRVYVGGMRGKVDTHVSLGEALLCLGATPPPRTPRQPHTAPNSVQLAVVWEDDQLAVIVKPWGIKCHGRGTRTVKHVVAGFLQGSTAADALPKPHPVHRLDALTGGLLVVAKTRSAAAALSASFEHRQVSKRYRAIVAGALQPSTGAVSTAVGGREAHTRYAVASVTRSLKFGGWVSTVDLYPHTGRRHQLRCHMAELGHPILGDALYTPPGMDLLRGQGMMLWAAALRLPHPSTGAALELEVAEPVRFAQLRAREAARWAKLEGGSVDGGE